MGKNKRLSHDQKRKAKLKKRAERSRSQELLAYKGNKYRVPELVPFMHRTETGIYESYVMSDYKLKDDTVEDALVRMITLMRQGHQFELPSGDTVDSGPAPEDQRDLVIANILRNWRYYSEEDGLPRQDDVIGVLRTILHSLDIWRWKNMSAQGYLQFLEGFLKETGVSVQRISPEELELLDEDIEDEKFEDED